MTSNDYVLPNAAIQGIRHFNAHRYFEAHEELETAWRAEPGPIRELFRGILQLGVAYYHLSRGNITGARKLLNSSMKWLSAFPPICQGINLDAVRQDILQTQNLLAKYPDGAHVIFDPYQFKPIQCETNTEDL